MIGGVFFDLGGTLFSYRNVPRATVPLLFDATERLGVRPDEKRIKDAYTQAGEDIVRAYADKPYYLHRDFFADTFMRFTELIDAAPDDIIQNWYRDAHRAAIINCLVLKEDCIETLKHLRHSGLYLSVVSNIDDDMLHPLIEREGLANYLDHWTSSEAAQSCKPHQRFFEHALELSQLSPAAVLFVGDSPEQDIVGAHAAGMRTALIVDDGMEPPMQTGRETVTPDHTVHTLAELRNILQA